ncbi:MAG: hypothetical protein ACYTEK_17020 [Planctomycetota bacterium]
MNNHTVILAETLLLLVVMSSFGIYFLIILEILRQGGVFRGKNAVILSLLISTIIATGPIPLMLIPHTPTDVEPARHFIIDHSLWASWIVAVETCVFIFFIVAVTLVSGEKQQFLDDDEVDLLKKSMGKPTNEKSRVRESEEVTSRAADSSS